MNWKQSVATNGGDRLERPRLEIDQLTGERASAGSRKPATTANCLPRSANAQPAMQPVSQMQQGATGNDPGGSRTASGRCERRNGAGVTLRQGRQHALRADELRSLQARKSNIPADQVAHRTALCTALDIGETEISLCWRTGPGARRRTRLGRRSRTPAAQLRSIAGATTPITPPSPTGSTDPSTYCLVLPSRSRARPGHGELPAQNAGLPARKLAVVPDFRTTTGLRHELVRRFDVACCTTAEQFRRETDATHQAGQIKSPGEPARKRTTATASTTGAATLAGWSNHYARSPRCSPAAAATGNPPRPGRQRARPVAKRKPSADSPPHRAGHTGCIHPFCRNRLGKQQHRLPSCKLSGPNSKPLPTFARTEQPTAGGD